MVELKVCKFGNSLGVVLPEEVIDRLQTGDGEPLFLIEASDAGKPVYINALSGVNIRKVLLMCTGALLRLLFFN
jgi:hypothetical protein